MVMYSHVTVMYWKLGVMLIYFQGYSAPVHSLSLSVLTNNCGMLSLVRYVRMYTIQHWVQGKCMYVRISTCICMYINVYIYIYIYIYIYMFTD